MREGGLPMLYQYHCACCDKVVASTDKSCPYCGSHHIRSPYGLWMFCVMACLAVVVVFKVFHIYIQNHQDTPTQSTLLDVLNEGDKTTKQ